MCHTWQLPGPPALCSVVHRRLDWAVKSGPGYLDVGLKQTLKKQVYSMSTKIKI